MKTSLWILAVLLSFSSAAQTNSDYLMVKHSDYGINRFGWVFINQLGDTITKLDTAKYYMCFSDTITSFAVVGIRQKPGWMAIDKDENILFEVYNTSRGEPNPDELSEGFIRIIDRKKIGFANSKGKIVIKPHFEFVSAFNKGNAIIGTGCKEVLWCCEGDHEDKHYITRCKGSATLSPQGRIKTYPKLPPEKLAEKLGWDPNE